MFDAVVWDYDGTLVDTRAADEAAVAALVTHEPALAGGVPRFWETEGRPITERLELAWPGRGHDLVARFDEGDLPGVFPGVRRVLSALRRRGLGLAVVSSRRCEPLRRGLLVTRLHDCFAAIIGLESVTVCKPDPEGLHLALSALGVSPARAVYVGDRDSDLEAAGRAGMSGWQATWGHPMPPHVRWPVHVHRPADVVARVDAVEERAG